MIYRALVRDSRDPAKKGRIKVSIPQVFGNEVTDWIWPVINSGFLVVPKSGEQVWVAFEGGDRERPTWLGKTAVTGAYKTEGGPVGRLDVLLDRIQQLEDDVEQLQADVAALQSGKANVGHSH